MKEPGKPPRDPESAARHLDAVPMFPLPNVVLFPRAILPLHIFEHRYRRMTADVLTGDRLLAMAVLKPGWEHDYYQRPAVHPVVCVGTILSHEILPDGKYNFLLQGLLRATIVDEIVDDSGYRRATLSPLPESSTMEIDLEDQRREFINVFQHPFFSSTRAGQQFTEFLGGSVPTSDIADLAAFHLVDDLPFKLRHLADTDVRGRVTRVAQWLRTLLPEAGASRADLN